ncbi:hypothetical protein FACUT_8347 [Fusarium acutatum]|uniref:F-box domain-containing protein n=1 Tax=Fusarium acutatum TaxID=78861 RepID=A0A8H4JMZ5_9HYPO|nr:hypothetical protein FACUT_8347 [Fusarium acutatum]
MEGLPPTDIRLPAEIVLMVCSYLCKQDHLRSRLVSSKLHYAATIQAFRSLRLKPDGDSPLQFRQVALSDNLRTFVKEVAIDTELDPGLPFHSDTEEFLVCQKFLQFLPYLSLFNNLRHLHLRFSRSSNLRGNSIEEGWYCRYLVLDIISHFVTGMWTPKDRKKVYDTVPPEGNHMFTYTHDASVLLGDSLQIKELTISHLADYNDPRLIQPKAWNKLLRLPTLVDLTLLVGENHAIQKLQVLSLFYTDYWGWFPRMGLDQLGDLPVLKVLALGRYIFTDKKQTDWIASLGQNNKSGGLEKLYLDECCILFEAKQHGPLTADGYPVPSAAIDWNADIKRTEYGRRWHHVLSEWRCLFAKGDCSLWKGRWQATRQSGIFFAHPGPENSVTGFLEAYESRRDKSRAVPMGNYLLGEGLIQSRRALMRYAWYDVRKAPEEETVEFDNAAYALLMEATRDRLRS